MTQFSTLLEDTAANVDPLTTILQRTLVVAAKLKSDELEKWVKLELKGYPKGENLPDYRLVPMSYFGHFNGSFGAAAQNVPLTTAFIPADVRCQLEKYEIPNDMASIESLLSEGVATFVKPQPLYVTEVFRQYSESVSGLTLNVVDGVITKAAFVSLVSQVRSRLLEFFLYLLKQFPELASNDSSIKSVSSMEVTNATRQMIFQHCTVQNGEITMGDNYSAQQAGAMGPNASARNMTFQQIWNANSEQLQINELAKELNALVLSLREHATTPDHKVAIGNVEAAADAASEGNGPKALEYLKSAGAWVFDTATSIGIGVATAAAKSMLGY